MHSISDSLHVHQGNIMKNENTPDTQTKPTAAPVVIGCSDLLCSLVAHVYDDHVILQEATYIEDGWYLKIIPSQIQLWEIPQYGGEETLECTFQDLSEAVKYARNFIT